MIPSHSLPDRDKSSVVINKLSKSNEYDYSEPHRHEYYELFYFQEGGGVHEIDFVPFQIESHSFQLVVPGQVHQMKRDPGSMGYVFLFRNEDVMESKVIVDFLMDFGAHDFENPHACANLNESEAQLVDTIIVDAWKNKDELSPSILKHTLIGLCLRMREKLPLNDTSTSSDYSKFRQLLVNDFRSVKKVSEYAEKLNMTPKSLNSLVKKHSGQTASEQIYKQVILEAKRLLLLQVSVKEAAYALQFDDPAHFSKFFKNQVGVSPAEFQKVQS
ncbi:MAG: helix-turn-helix domain-containing protein [Flavobacteriales bacterium]|nr:helix-turn-helix domain-containing protein [Flavobacteriales bacterium]